MPFSNVPDDKQDAMHRCVMDLKDKGHDEQSAVAICYTSVVEGKSLSDAIAEYFLPQIKASYDWDKCILDQTRRYGDKETAEKVCGEIRAKYGSGKSEGAILLSDNFDLQTALGEIEQRLGLSPKKAWIESAIKIGMRNSRADQTRLQMIHDYAAENGAKCDGDNAKALDADSLVTFGDAVKAIDLGDGKIKVTGYLIRFGSEKDTDLTGDYFDKQTDFAFNFPGKSHTWFNHRLPVETKRGPMAISDRFDSASLSVDDVGVLLEGVLDERKAYEAMLIKLGRAGKLGLSSGTASHLVKRTPHGSANHIDVWPLGLDASYTHAPAEYRNQVVPIKSLTTQPIELDDLPETASKTVSAMSQPATDANLKTNSQESNMSDEQLTALTAQITALGTEVAGLKKIIEDAPAVKTLGTGVEVISDPADRPFKSVAEQCRAIKAAVKSQGRQYDVRLSRLDAIKAIQGANETVPEDGGYLLEPTISPELLKPIHDFGMFSSAARPMPVMSNSNSGWINGVDETDLSAGLTWGGVIAYRVAEGGDLTKSKPKFRRINWQLKKYAALVYDTDELLQDSGQFQAVANQACNEAIVFLQNDDIVRGDGAAGCWGILSNGSLVTVTKETGQAADTVVFKNLSKMWQRLLPQSRANATWFINSEVEPELDELSIPAGTSALEPRFITYDQQGVMRIKGRPVVVTPFNSALGDAGDIILGDMSAYLLWTKGGIQTAQSIHVEFLTDQNVFRFIARADGQPVLASAITPFKGTNTQSNFVTLGAR